MRVGRSGLSALAVTGRGNYCADMSAAELLKQLRAPPPRERQGFVLGVAALAEEALAKPKGNARRVKWPDAV